MWKKIVDNWPMKLLAMGLAVLVWFYANSVVIRTTQVEVYFDVSCASPNVDVQVDLANRPVTLTVSGPEAVIQELSRRNVQIAYRVGDTALAADRTDKIPFDARMVTGLPAQAQVVAFAPKSFTLTLRRLETLRVPVNPPVLEGKPAPGYVAEPPEIRGSAFVWVTGPASALDRLAREHKGVDPEPVDVTNHTEPIRDRKLRIQTALRVDNTTTESIRCDESVEVFVDIHRALVAGEVRGVPVSVLLAPGAAVDVEITSGNPVDLPVEGPPDLVKELTADKLRAFIDVRSRRPESDLPFFEKLVVEGLPDGVRVAKDIVITAKFKLPAKPPEKAAP